MVPKTKFKALIRVKFLEQLS